jgi:MATE family multidrug resistance protein
VLRAPAYAPYPLFSGGPPRAGPIGELLRLGLPMGFSSFVEITAFTLIALLVARLGATVVAGHRIVGNLSALIYMLPWPWPSPPWCWSARPSAPGTARRPAGRAVGILLATGLSTLVSIVAWLYRDALMAAYTADPAVSSLAVSLVIYICLYQFFDAIQTVAAHALRGYKITFGPMLVHTLCFWGIGLAGATGWPTTASAACCRPRAWPVSGRPAYSATWPPCSSAPTCTSSRATGPDLSRRNNTPLPESAS